MLISRTDSEGRDPCSLSLNMHVQAPYGRLAAKLMIQREFSRPDERVVTAIL